MSNGRGTIIALSCIDYPNLPKLIALTEKKRNAMNDLNKNENIKTSHRSFLFGV